MVGRPRLGGTMVMFGCNVWLHNRHHTTHTTRTRWLTQVGWLPQVGCVTQVGWATPVGWATQVGGYTCTMVMFGCNVWSHNRHNTTHTTRTGWLTQVGWLPQVGWSLQVGWVTQVGWGTQLGGYTCTMVMLRELFGCTTEWEWRDPI